MKTNIFKYIGVGLVVCSLASCDDQIMEWMTPNGHGAVTKAEIPLQVKEVLANYDNIKDYATEYAPNMIVGVGLGASIYTDEEDPRRTLANDNFQMITLGNAMKADALVGNTGALNFATVDRVIESMPAGMKLYGHNFFWYQQQNQTYLKSLIAPDISIETDGDIASVLKNGYFDNDISGWIGWGGSSTREWDATGGVDGSGGAKIYNPKSGNLWDVQFCQDLPAPAEPGTYILRFKARTDGVGHIQVCLQQPSDGYPAVGYETFEVGSSWTTCEKEITVTDDGKSYTRLCINTGQDVATYWIDNVEFGAKIEGPTNYCDNGSFESGTDGWTINNAGAGIEAVELADAVDGSHALKATASESSANYWDCQITTPAMPTFPGEQVRISFFIKSDQPGQARVSYASGSEISNQWPWINWTGSQSSWTESFETSSGWLEINYIMQNYSHDFVDGAATWRFCIDLGKLPGVTYYIDNVRVTKVSEEQTSAKASGMRLAPRRATKMVYTFKTAEEKQAILTTAMESFIQGVAEHLKEKGVTPAGYDVINEAIADGQGYGVRGISRDGSGNVVFGGSTTDDDGVTTYDAEPTEDTENGLQLNWGGNRFYWGYFVPDYGVKAFQLARKHLPAETKLFINDYNLETSEGKLAALIKWVQDIDAANGSPIVDGIGTQMHVSFSPTDDTEANATKLADLKARIDKHFQTLASTGKLIRVTELDIAIGTSSPSAAQYKAQADAYRMIFESYKTNIPQAQQHGITIWSVSDAEDEHEYWLKGEVPNLWDANYLRKWAYKGVCDGIAGEDLGLKYGGDDYKAYYEKQNVSASVE